MTSPAATQRATTRDGNVLLLVGLAAGTAAFLGLLYWPVEREISELRHELQHQQQLMEEALLLPAQVGRVKDDALRTASFVAHWRSMSGHQPAQLYGAISQAIAAHGVTTTQFQPDPFIDRNYLREVTVRVSCRGTLHQLFASLRALEALPWTLWVEELRLTRDRENPANLVCEMKLGVFTEKSAYSD